MANKTALGYVLDDDGKLIDAFIQATGALDPAPTQVELEIVRIVKEHRVMKAELLKNGYNLTWHVCSTDKIRPYPALLCSTCLPVDKVREFNPLDELDRIDKLETALERIDTWAKAYPLEVFPKPDLKKAAEVLKASGMTLDAISADAMRHVLDGIKEIVIEAMEGKPQDVERNTKDETAGPGEAMQEAFVKDVCDRVKEAAEILNSKVKIILNKLEKPEVELEMLRDMQGVKLGPGDVIVLKHPSVLCENAWDNLKKLIKKEFPDNKCLVLEEGMEIGVIAKQVKS